VSVWIVRGDDERQVRDGGQPAMKEALKATLRDLSTLHGVSGFEQPLVEYFRKRVTGLVDDVQVDRYGNVTATKRGRQERPRLMLAAHLDEIGFIVKAIDERGFLSFDRLGGMGDGILPCRRVTVNGHFGLIGAKSGHLLSAEKQARPPVVADMYIDVGASSAAEVAALGVRVGDPVTFVGELAEFTGGDRVCAKAMDDRMGVAILIQVLTELAGAPAAGPVLAVATVLEQVGLRGAIMATPRIAPDYAIAIDGLSAGDTPDSSTTRDLPVVMGRGPVALLAASSTTLHVRGSIAHPAMKRHLLAAAEAAGVPMQLATHLARGSTDAAAIHLSAGGIPTISIGVPRRYSYSPNEVVDLNDLAGAVRVLTRFIGDMGKHHDLAFV
jgi:putative aminopeptidase